MTFKNSIKKTIFLLFFSFCFIIHSQAQSELSNTGKEFYVAFGKNTAVTTVSGIELTLRVTASVNTSVTFHFTENPSLDETILVSAGEIRNYFLSTAQKTASYSINANNIVFPDNRKSVYVTATNPITLIAVNTANSTSIEAALVYPVEALGTDYIHCGITPLASHTDGYLLVATADNTKITITPAPYYVPDHLDKGDVFYYTAATQDIGTRITSDKPVAFFQSGTRESASPGTGHDNYTFEQIPPVNQWGRDFILPTNVLWSLGTNPTPTDPSFDGGAFARVYPQSSPFTFTVTYTDGTPSETFTQANAPSGYVDIIIDATRHPNAKACYISSLRVPLSVYAYNYPKNSGDYIQPGLAWLPPVEQKIRQTKVSPLALNSASLSITVYHYFEIIVPTANRDETVISIDGNSPQFLQNSPNFSWVADNIGGSGYSFGRYYIGSSGNFGPGGSYVTLNTTAQLYNSAGMIVLVYGQGSYTNYFYNSGSLYRDLSATYYVNDETYIDMDGRSYCNTSNIDMYTPNRPPPPIIWTLNGEEIPDSRDEQGASLYDLPDGYYTVNMFANGADHITHFWIGGGASVWTPEANTLGTVAEKQDWNNMANWTPPAVPTECRNVYIPGNSPSYPVLTTTTNAACNNIYFMQGARVVRPDLLHYKKAHIQYNFGLSETPQITNRNDKNLVLSSSDVNDRMLYSASVSSPLSRERWYMLSSPLLGAVSGDFCFGGFPLTFMMKFGPINKDDVNYPVGNWTTPYTSTVERLSPTEGFAFYMYGYGMTGDNTGSYESGAYSDLSDFDYMPNNGRDPNQLYGIKEVNGILEVPFFEDAKILNAHRTQIYDAPTRESTFYTTNGNFQDPVNFNRILESPTTIASTTREDHNGNYHFIPETYSGGTWTFQNPILHSTTGLEKTDVFMVGNPYMSAIDMLEFCKDNFSSINSSFRLWDGTRFNDFFVNIVLGTITRTSGDMPVMRYLAPLQGFFLSSTGTGEDVKFDVEKISTVLPEDAEISLRSAQAPEENLLRVKAENDYASSFAVIGYDEGASSGFTDGKDVKKLFSPYNYVPEVYSLAGDVPASIRFISNKVETTVPMGIKGGVAGKMQLTFTGMDNYSKASKIEFIDALEGKTVDLTGMQNYIYSYNNKETGIQNGRFLFRISNTTTALTDVNPDDLKIYGASEGIYVISTSADPVQNVTVYDFQGRKLYESASGAQFYPLQENFGHSPLIVKVTTKNQVKSVKLSVEK